VLYKTFFNTETSFQETAVKNKPDLLINSLCSRLSNLVNMGFPTTKLFKSRMREVRNVNKILVVKPEGKRHPEDLDVNDKVILGYILDK
jgi:hypothetical protein